MQEARAENALNALDSADSHFAAILIDMFIGNDIIPELAQVS